MADQLSRLQALAKQQAEAERDVARAEQALKDAKTALREIAEQRIPELMDEYGVETFTTRAGLHVAIQEIIRASIPKAHTQEAIAWLREHGHAALIKRTVAVQFGAGEDEYAEATHAELERQGYAVQDAAKVHPQTLGAFVRERLEAGEELPQDLLGVYRQRVAKIS